MSDLLAATVPLLAPAFSLGGTAVSWLELVALLLSVWMVLCNLRVNPLGWPLAMASSALYGLLFLHSKLYGEAGLQVLFILLAGWGWWQWLRGMGDHGKRLVVHWLGQTQRKLAALITLAAWPCLGLALQRLTDSDVPYLDALPTVGSIAGQILLARKQVENWAVWAAVNIVSMVLFASKELWLTVGLYALFAVLAVVGWRRWAELANTGHARG